jgi:hypothetical protein
MEGLKEANIFLLWCGLKHRDRCPLTEQEFEKFCEAHDIAMSKAYMLCIKSEHYAYIPGEPFKD